METASDQSDYQRTGTGWEFPVFANRRRPRVQTAGLTSVLSLFLLLLAFFIMLNSMAQFEARRTRAVLGSLAATFNVSDPDGHSRTLGSFVGHVEAVDDLDRDITGLLRTLVGFGSFELIRTGNVLSTSIDNSVLFAGDGSPTAALRSLVKPAAGLLAAASADAIVEVTAYARPAGGKVVGATRAEIRRAAVRAAAAARTFGEFGVAPDQLVVALEDGDPDRTRFEFRVLEKPPAAGGGL